MRGRFSRSGIYSCSQASESPKPHTVDIIAPLGLSLMRHSATGAWWRSGRMIYLVPMCSVQCTLIHLTSTPFLWLFLERADAVAFRMRALPFGSVRSVHSFLRAAPIAVSEFWCHGQTISTVISHMLWWAGISRRVHWLHVANRWAGALMKLEIRPLPSTVRSVLWGSQSTCHAWVMGRFSWTVLRVAAGVESLRWLLQFFSAVAFLDWRLF